MIIFRPTDRIPVQIADVTFWLSPLTYAQKTTLLSFFRMKAGEEQVDNRAYAFKAVRMCLKEVEGVTLPTGEAYALEFDETGELTQECLDDVLLLGNSTKLLQACDLFIFKGLETGDLDGVTVDLSKARVVKKK